MNKVFAVGVGPGSPKYVTDIVKEAISQCDIVICLLYTSDVCMARVKIIFWRRWKRRNVTLNR